MGDFGSFERFYRFDDQVRRKKYPNARWLVETFEINERTARRNIDFMRDRLHAPLEYDATERGYYYPDESFQLPRFQISQEEILSLLIAKDLLVKSAGGHISDRISSFFEKLISIDGGIAFGPDEIGAMFSSSWVGHRPTRPDIFKSALQSLLEKRILEMSYSSTSDGLETVRHVEPHHLQHYMGSWMMLAWCRKRNDWRSFALARIGKTAVLDGFFMSRPPVEWRHKLEGAYGLFQGADLVKVVLRFNRFRAAWVRDECWHPDQTLEELADGSLRLSFPVSAFQEVKMRILQYGADVVVEEPPRLRQDICSEIEKMECLYKNMK